MQKTLFLIGLFTCTTLAQAEPMTSIYKNQEMDIEEAHLVRHNQRVDEVAAAHNRYVSIRAEMIEKRYRKPMEDWHVRAQAWFAAWQSIIAVMHSEELADAQTQDDTINRMREQMKGLDRLESEALAIRKEGEAALAALKTLPDFPGDYIDVDQYSEQDTYKDFIQLYRTEVQTSKSGISAAQVEFSESIMKALRKVTEKLDMGLSLRIKALMINYPGLKQKLMELEKTLVTLREIDYVMAGVARKANAVQMILQDERIYEATRAFAQWQKESQAALAQISGASPFASDIQSYAANLVSIHANRLEADFNRQLESRSKQAIFAQYYSREMNGAFGLVPRCLDPENRPIDIDCNLLRLIQGFKGSQIQKMTDEQAEYIENIIAKAKRGVLR